MRLAVFVLALAVGCSKSDPESESKGSEDAIVEITAIDTTPIDGAIEDTTVVDTAIADLGTDTALDAPEVPAVATCLEQLDGTTATPTSGTGKLTWAKSYTADGWFTAGAGTASTLFVSGFETGATPKVDALDISPKSTDGGRTAFIAKLGLDGTPVWTRGIAGGATGGPFVFLAVVGTEVAFALTSDTPYALSDKAGAADTMAFGVLRADGTTRSFVTFPVGTGARPIAIAVDGGGLIHLVAELAKPIDVAGTTLDCKHTLLVLDADAKTKWGRCIDVLKGSLVSVDGFGVDNAGNTYVSGYPRNEIDIGDGKKTLDNSFGASALFKIDPTGKTVWSQLWFRAYARGLAVAADGTIYTHGHVPGKTDAVIANTLVKKCDVGFEQAITKLDSSGKWLWTRMLGNSPLDEIALADDGVWFKAQSSGTGEIAKGIPAPSAHSIGKVSSSGAVTMLQTFVAESDATMSPMAVRLFSRGGAVLVVGQMSFDFKVGTTTLKKKGFTSDLAFSIAP